MPAGLEDLFPPVQPREPDAAAGELRRALVVAAHPDDADFGAAGTAALLARDGWDVRYVVATDGSKGSDDPTQTPASLAALRAEEQREAARILGVQSVGFLGFVDGELERSRALLEAVTREIRAFRPFAVYTHDPEPLFHQDAFVNHSDHRTIGYATVDAIYPTARDRLNFPEHLEAGLEPHRVRAIYLFGSERPNSESDISAVIETKLTAMRAHASQFSSEFLEQMPTFWREPDGRYVERFRRVLLQF